MPSPAPIVEPQLPSPAPIVEPQLPSPAPIVESQVTPLNPIVEHHLPPPAPIEQPHLREPIYFEHQERANCAIHALNNAFQASEFTEREFILREGLANVRVMILLPELPLQRIQNGNFNLESINAVLGSRGFEMQHIRNDEIERLARNPNNLPVGMYLVGTGTGRMIRGVEDIGHWFSLRRFTNDGPIWNLDSLSRDSRPVRSLRNLLCRSTDGSWYNFYRIVRVRPTVQRSIDGI